MTLDLTDRALLRGWLQGLTWFTLAETYLPGTLPSAAKQRVEMLLAELFRRARLADRADLAATLAGGPATERSRRAAEAALETILRLPEPRPRLADAVRRWLPPRIAHPLERAGLPTLRDVAAAGAVADWWRAVPRLGAGGAETVRTLFRGHPELGPLQEAAILPLTETRPVPRARTSDLAPLEYFRPPEELAGRDRANRAPPERLRIAAPTDAEALHAWLAQWPEDSATRRAYRKEAERFWLWAVLVRGRALSALTVEDAVAYRGFVRDPKPRERWVGALAPRTSAAWRPFQDRLSERSAQYAETVLRGLCAWLVEVGYLTWSPFGGLRRVRRTEERLAAGRALSEREWQWVLGYCDLKLADSNEDPAYFRHVRFALRLGYVTGLRISNLAAATVGDLERREGRRGAGTQWWLHARVKGDKPHQVPVTGLLPELREYLAFRGYAGPLETLDPELPLIGKRRRTRTARGYREQPYTPAGLHELIRPLFEAAGIALALTDPVSGERIRNATTHVLRHTHATHALDRGVPVSVAQRNLGHSSLAITSHYLSVDEDQRHAELEKLFRTGPRTTEENPNPPETPAAT